jgi:hypothetical protein
MTGLAGLTMYGTQVPPPALSAVLKPLPVTVTIVPIGPELGVRVIVGVVAVTVKVVERVLCTIMGSPESVIV